jgi:hypothetical protein
VEALGKFSQAVRLDALRQVLPAEVIAQVLQDCQRVTQRKRKLNLVLTTWVVIGLYRFARCSPQRVLAKLAQGCRLLWGDGEYPLPGDSALCYRRTQLGVRPLAELVRRCCRPQAEPDCPGAFRFGLRLVALDGTVDAVADTPANLAAFGRAASQHGPSAFPQVRGVHLVECGTHLLVDVTFWPFRVGERRGAFRLLRSVQPGWLLLWDAGFHDFDLFVAAQARGAQVLAVPLPYVHLEPVRLCPDGSYLAYLRPAARPRRRRGERLLVRVVDYRLTDPALPGHDQAHRLVSTLLDPARYPALDLVETYHARWEFEVTLDEIETHQRLTDRTLRGRSPRRVLQELYGLVLAHYCIRALMLAAARQAGLAPTQLSFSQAVELIRQAIPEFQWVVPEQWPDLTARLLRDLARARLPARRFRTAPRVVRRRLSKFPTRRPQHLHPPQPSPATFRECIALI